MIFWCWAVTLFCSANSLAWLLHALKNIVTEQKAPTPGRVRWQQLAQASSQRKHWLRRASAEVAQAPPQGPAPEPGPHPLHPTLLLRGNPPTALQQAHPQPPTHHPHRTHWHRGVGGGGMGETLYFVGNALEFGVKGGPSGVGLRVDVGFLDWGWSVPLRPSTILCSACNFAPPACHIAVPQLPCGSGAGALMRCFGPLHMQLSRSANTKRK